MGSSGIKIFTNLHGPKKLNKIITNYAITRLYTHHQPDS